jgi:hypothetical protein
MTIMKNVEDCRDASLDVVAAALESIHRARAAYSGCEPAPERGRGDFLYDMVNLHVGYWTQMARLGSAYSVYAQRVLTTLYGAYAAPPCAPPKAATTRSEQTYELCFEGAPGDRQTRHFTLPRAPQEGWGAAPIQVALMDRNETLEVQVTVHVAPPADGRAAPKGSTRVAAQVAFPDSASARCWRGKLVVPLGEAHTAEYGVTLRVL